MVGGEFSREKNKQKQKQKQTGETILRTCEDWRYCEVRIQWECPEELLTGRMIHEWNIGRIWI